MSEATNVTLAFERAFLSKDSFFMSEATNVTLAELAQEWLKAKQAETAAQQARREIAAKIQDLTGHKSEGSKTYKDGNFKLSLKQPITVSMDWEKWESVKAGIPEDLWPVESKLCLDTRGVKWLQNNEPETYAILSECLTVKPAAFEVRIIEEEV